ncbi:MAG: hypothetical protein JRI59_06860 [Deltaproteobacteria bacterium]|nr:hypothetical protein [Deltaproteobacteria bacterium]
MKDLVMLAIPVLRSRVAPVLDWCSRIRIFPAEPSPEELARELILPHLEAAQRLKVLRDQGVEVLICGALSPALHYYAQELGFTVVSGVAGDVKEVVQSYWDNTLDHPRFRLPGYRGGCGCRGRWRGGRGALGPGRNGAASRAGRKRGLDRTQARGQESGNFWVCPGCRGKVLVPQVPPGTPVRCPRCGQVMKRI